MSITRVLDRLAAAHEAKLVTITMPSLIVHGLLDDLVPVENALATAELLIASKVTAELVEGAGADARSDPWLPIGLPVAVLPAWSIFTLYAGAWPVSATLRLCDWEFDLKG